MYTLIKKSITFDMSICLQSYEQNTRSNLYSKLRMIKYFHYIETKRGVMYELK